MAPSGLDPNLYLGGSFASISVSSVDVGFVVHLLCHVGFRDRLPARLGEIGN